MTHMQHRKNESRLFYKIRKYKVTLVLLLINLTIMAILLSLMMHTDMQSENINSYRNQISDLTIQNQLLQEQIAQSQDLSNISMKASELGMVQVKSVVYLNSSGIMSYNMQSAQ